mmetsp:Transcript_40905/g.76087  ORF Transcript_40905/g.76087 Transcript_40905/m.76087 type:complete len:92 (+) Transcript_40905:706-981(+)
MMQYCIDQCATPMARSWVHNKACRLVDYEYVVIFKKNVEIPLLWSHGKCPLIQQESHIDHVSSVQITEGFFPDTTIHVNGTLTNQSPKIAP